MADGEEFGSSAWPSVENRRSAAIELERQSEWVIGADGKVRRVKPGICLLAHGVPARVAKLRALGNAIDLRLAAAFIEACA
jgi:DNA (cytosine-5)-methyltransferase 1